MLVVLVTGVMAFDYFLARQRIVAFDQFMAPSKILGKAPTQIISVYGKPYYDTLDTPDPTIPKNHRVIAYQGAYGEMCRIEFIDDKAARADLGGK